MGRPRIASVVLFALLTLITSSAPAGGIDRVIVSEARSDACDLPASNGAAASDQVPPAPTDIRQLIKAEEQTVKTAESGTTQSLVLIVISTGLGVTPKDALDHALEAAVSQALGRLIHSDTLLENDELIYDKIMSATSGFVERFEKLSEGRSEGLHTVRIRAEVRSDKLRAEVASKVEGARGVDGQSLRAKILTRASATADARELVSTLLSRLPRDLLVAKLLGDPEAVEGVKLPEGVTRLRLPIEVSLDEGRWSARSADIMRALETLAVESRTASMRLTPRSLVPGDDLAFGMLDEGEGKLLVCKDLGGADWPGAKPAAGVLRPSRMSQASIFLEANGTNSDQMQNQCWESYAAFNRSIANAASTRLNQPIETVFVVHGNMKTAALSVTTYAVPAAIVENALKPFAGTLAISVSAHDAGGAKITSDDRVFTVAPARSYWSDAQSAAGGTGGFRSNSGSQPVSFLLSGRGSRSAPGTGDVATETMVVPGLFIEDRAFTATIEFGVIHSWKGNMYLDISTSQIDAIHELRCTLEVR